MTRMTELLQINLLTLLGCIPIVTAGAALSAMHACLQRMERRDEGYMGRLFCDNFIRGFKKATLLWIPFALIFLGVMANIFVWITAPQVLPMPLRVVSGTAGIITFFIFQWVYPLQVRFELPVTEILRMALFLAAARFPKTLLMSVCWCVPVILLRFMPAWPLIVLFGLSVPGWVGTKIYSPILRELEGTK